MGFSVGVREKTGLSSTLRSNRLATVSVTDPTAVANIEASPLWLLSAWLLLYPVINYANFCANLAAAESVDPSEAPPTTAEKNHRVAGNVLSLRTNCFSGEILGPSPSLGSRTVT